MANLTVNNFNDFNSSVSFADELRRYKDPSNIRDSVDVTEAISQNKTTQDLVDSVNFADDLRKLKTPNQINQGVNNANISVKSYATTAEIEVLEPEETGQRVENQERANAQYVLAAAGYVAQAGDITAANGRVWKYTPNEVINIESIKELDSVVLSEKAQYRVKSFYPNATVGGGDFSYSATEDKANHNGITIIDPLRATAWDGTSGGLSTLFTAGTGSGCFVRNDKVNLPLESAGLIADWNGSTGTDNTTAFNQLLSIETVKVIEGNGDDYYFGTATNNVAQHTVTRDLIIDWRGSSIIINSVSGAAGVGTAFIAFVDCKAKMHNYTFDDLDFEFTSTSRGVIPVLIKSSTQSTSGHRIGPCHIERGQSVLSCISDDPNTHRASDVKLVGPCSGGNVYYGVNLAANGDNFTGELSLVETLRAMFIYNIKNFDLKCACETSRASSGFINISNYPQWRSTDNINASVTVNSLAGPLLIATVSNAPENDGVGTIAGVNISLKLNELGGAFTTSSNVVQIRSFDSTAATMADGTAEIDRINIELDSPLELSNPIGVITSSPNYGGLSLKGANANYTGLSDFHILNGENVVRSLTGDTTVAIVETELKYLISPASGPQQVRLKVDVSAQESSAFFGQNSAIESFNVIGFASGGSFTILTAESQGQTKTGVSNPVISISSNNGKMQTSVSGFNSNSGGQITVTSRALQ